MGRKLSETSIIEESQELDLSVLCRQGTIQKNRTISGTIALTDCYSINFISSYTAGEKYFRVVHITNSNGVGETSNYDYKIELLTIPSNLCQGEILYFVCPITGRRARILYWSDENNSWQSRFAFDHGLYYKSQLSLKSDYHEDRYRHLKKQLQELNQQVKKAHYRGQPTRLQLRINNLESRKEGHKLLMLISYYQICDKLQYMINYKAQSHLYRDTKNRDYYLMKFKVVQEFLSGKMS
jgi:hypothetical protein